MRHLLTVEAVDGASDGPGVTLRPLLPMPPGFVPFLAPGDLRDPSGGVARRALRFAPVHLHTEGGPHYWRIGVHLPAVTSASLPQGTEVWVDDGTAKRLGVC